MITIKNDRSANQPLSAKLYLDYFNNLEARPSGELKTEYFVTEDGGY